MCSVMNISILLITYYWPSTYDRKKTDYSLFQLLFSADTKPSIIQV